MIANSKRITIFIFSKATPIIKYDGKFDIKSTKTNPILSKINIDNSINDQCTITVDDHNEKTIDFQFTTIEMYDFDNLQELFFESQLIQLFDEESIEITLNYVICYNDIHTLKHVTPNYKDYNNHLNFILLNLRQHNHTCSKMKIKNLSQSILTLLLNIKKNFVKIDFSLAFLKSILEFHLKDLLNLSRMYIYTSLLYYWNNLICNLKTEYGQYKIDMNFFDLYNSQLNSEFNQEIISDFSFLERIVFYENPEVLLYGYTYRMHKYFIDLAPKYVGRINQNKAEKILNERISLNAKCDIRYDLLESLLIAFGINYDFSKFNKITSHSDSEWYDGLWEDSFDENFRSCNGFVTSLDTISDVIPFIALPHGQIQTRSMTQRITSSSKVIDSDKEVKSSKTQRIKEVKSNK